MRLRYLCISQQDWDASKAAKDLLFCTEHSDISLPLGDGPTSFLCLWTPVAPEQRGKQGRFAISKHECAIHRGRG